MEADKRVILIALYHCQYLISVMQRINLGLQITAV